MRVHLVQTDEYVYMVQEKINLCLTGSLESCALAAWRKSSASETEFQECAQPALSHTIILL